MEGVVLRKSHTLPQGFPSCWLKTEQHALGEVHVLARRRSWEMPTEPRAAAWNLLSGGGTLRACSFWLFHSLWRRGLSKCAKYTDALGPRSTWSCAVKAAPSRAPSPTDAAHAFLASLLEMSGRWPPFSFLCHLPPLLSLLSLQQLWMWQPPSSTSLDLPFPFYLCKHLHSVWGKFLS